MSSAEPQPNNAPEQGDYIINFHLQYCAQLAFQAQMSLRNILDQIKTELMKIKTDGEFINQQLPGPHQNLGRLKNEDRDLRSILDPVNVLIDKFRLLSNRSSNRII